MDRFSTDLQHRVDDGNMVMACGDDHPDAHGIAGVHDEPLRIGLADTAVDQQHTVVAHAPDDLVKVRPQRIAVHQGAPSEQVRMG